MVVQFNISTAGKNFGSQFDAISYITERFITVLRDTVKPFGYKLINTEIINDIEYDTYTDAGTATANREYCYDFCFEKDGRKSREFRISYPVIKGKEVRPLIGVLCSEIPKKTTRLFREKTMSKNGRAYFLNHYIQTLVRGKNTISWNKRLKIMEQNTYYFEIIINDEIIIVHGGNQPQQSDSCVYGNYLSLIKCHNLYYENKFTWLCNGLYGYSDKIVNVHLPISLKAREPYALIGSQLKVQYGTSYEFEYGSAKIMILPTVRDFVNPAQDERYRVFFENIYGDKKNITRIMNTIRPASTKTCIILTE